MYRLLPVNSMTRLAGSLAAVEIPEALRKPIYGLYATLFGCRMDEAAAAYKDYSSFNNFFTRELKKEARIIDSVADLVSPADGKVMAIGRIEVPFARDPSDGTALAFPEAIKGVSYPLKQLVTPSIFSQLTASADRPLHYCTIYLSPGDYHRFHSPANWTKRLKTERIHGEVLSVAPFMMRWAKKLLCLNERTVLFGSWRHGAMAMIPVGATNVSSIKLAPEVEDNQFLKMQKGDLVGMFEMGSTVVLLFHAPKNFEWAPQVGDHIQMGQALGHIPRKYYLIDGWC